MNTLRSIFIVTFALTTLAVEAQNSPAIVHPRLGSSTETTDGRLRLKLVDRRQNYSGEVRTRDTDINSPKSVNIHPNGTKLYVNSLEGGKTVVYDSRTMKKLKVIDHRFTAKDAKKWSGDKDFYRFNHTYANPRTFLGKPVESAFSHNGRYLWVPYYRRSFDINAQDPSAVAVIDTQCDSIIILMDAGVLPKMIAVSPDSKTVAIAHWGDNTVGLIDISSPDPRKWRQSALIAVDRQLKWDLSLTTPVDRDSGSGNALRATVFTPDGKYLLVGCMGGSGGLAVIDLATKKYLGKLYGFMPNLRHAIISGEYLYVSINKAGYVQRVSLDNLYDAISRMTNKSATLTGISQAKVGAGARTIEASADGKYIFAACNFASKLAVVDAATMKTVGEISVDSYPVGLDVSKDGRHIYITSQGRKGLVPSGNCVDVIQIEKLQ